ncbi:hypothetical protein GIV49_22910 [Pseudomonas syringae]|uniref:hypothetical protein n=1 Tax=Pseudomonas syringae TaxID=317 RepID=UPI001F48C648|nr:hypothetical protein [Pseudomonas syringae]MCF5652388.1 hypothetical protein [Pseudomonas syringae]
MHYKQISSLEEFLSQVEKHLLDPGQRMSVSFPITSTAPWDADALADANASLLERVSGAANVYAIFTGECGKAGRTLRYFGKTTRKLARQRIRNHLFRKSEQTGSKLAEVLAHATGGGTVDIAWIEVHPESLRNYLEEELIIRHPEADWNRENRSTLRSKLGVALEDTAT